MSDTSRQRIVIDYGEIYRYIEPASVQGSVPRVFMPEHGGRRMPDKHPL